MKNNRKDLIILSADKNIEFSVRGILERTHAIGVQPLSYNVRAHPERDAGCLGRCHHFLRPFINRYSHALVVFDREGCGKDHLSRERLEADVEERLARNGWRDRSAAIVFDPELEIWVWSDSPHVDAVLGWGKRKPKLRTWLARQDFIKKGQTKPERPKEAMEAALRITEIARSSALFLELAERVSFKRCEDPAFAKLKNTLTKWFSTHRNASW